MEGAKISDEDKHKRGRSFRIGIDLDGPSQFEVLKAIFNAKYFFPESRIEVLETRKGYHVKIYREHTLQENFDVRRALGDDPIRLHFDEVRARRGLEDWVDTLFAVKWTPEGTSREKPTQILSEAFWTRLPSRKLERR